MEAFEEVERGLDWKMAVGQLRKRVLVIRLDGRSLFRQRELHAKEPVHVAIRDVMHELAHRPSARTIGRVELSVGEAAHRGAQARGQFSDRVDGGAAQRGVGRH